MHAFWNALFTLFFIGLVSVSFVWLSDQGKLVSMIPPYELVLLSLASFRLVRLFTYDHITASLRDWLSLSGERTFLGTAGALLKCPWCTGIWFSFLAYVGYAAFPNVVMPIATLLSIAALASCFQILANLVGWKAEAAKRKAQG